MDQYSIQKSIGTGSYGYVYLATHKAQKTEYVIKKIKMWDLKEEERQKIDNEVKLLRQFKHVNIVRYRDSFIDHQGFLNIVMTNCEGGDIYQLIEKSEGKRIQQKQLIDWAVQIALAIYYMHQKRILHRDLKTSNIFLNQGRVRLGDFGISKVLDQNKNFLAQTNIGTPLYMSPEQFRLKPYSYKSDIWAFGCCLYQMCSQKHVFYAQSVPALAAKIFKGEYAPITDFYSHQVREMIYKMLSQNSKGRPTIIEILQKPFMKRRVQSYIKELIAEGCYDNEVMKNLLQQAQSLGISLESPIESTPRLKSASKNSRNNSEDKKKRDREKAREYLEQQIIRESQERKKIQQRIKQIQIKKVTSQKLIKDRSHKNSQKKIIQKSANNSVTEKKSFSTEMSDSNIPPSKLQKKEEKRYEKPYLMRKEWQEKAKPFKMQEDHDLNYEEESDDDEKIIHEQLEEYEIGQEITQQKKQEKEEVKNNNLLIQKSRKEQKKESEKYQQKEENVKKILNEVNQENNELQLKKQIKIKSQKIQLLKTELQELQKLDLQFSSDSEGETKVKQNPTSSRITQKVNELKHKIISILGKDGYGIFMKYMINNFPKDDKGSIKKELAELIGNNRIGLWHIGEQIAILEKVNNSIPKFL